MHVPRPLDEQRLNSGEFRWVQAIMWSDPIEDSKCDKRAIFGVHSSPRGKSSNQFGWNVTKAFCARNGLGLVIRSHQSKQNSPGFEVMHENLLARVFSARDYEGHGNDGAVLLISPYNDEDGEDKVAATKNGVAPCAEARHLSVRAQVLGSTTKARAEARARRKVDDSCPPEAAAAEGERPQGRRAGSPAKDRAPSAEHGAARRRRRPSQDGGVSSSTGSASSPAPPRSSGRCGSKGRDEPGRPPRAAAQAAR
mmetsp:Transcript_78080/g.242073  ORF Transcript_78080/g.242073 Transcript_78080/m.242073 type:complete len:253 (+) Transcript_78080:668-1426(+)